MGTGCGAEACGGGVSVGNKANGVGGVGGVSVISDAVGVGAGDTSSVAVGAGTASVFLHIAILHHYQDYDTIICNT